MLTRPFLRSLIAHAALVGVALFIVPSFVSADTGKIKALLYRAEFHEKAYEWDKAFAAYDEVLKLDRDADGVRERQNMVLRRYWQEQRHKDISYRKEVLSLDYAQALRLNSAVYDTLIENSLPKARLSPGQLLKKGIEELEAALRDPGFAANYLGQSRPVALSAFREFLARKKVDAARFGRADCMNALREVALAAKSALDLSPTVVLMELACGACYGIDEYTSYLTPNQFRELTESVKTNPLVFVPSVQFGLRNPETAYLQITHFQETTPQEVEEAFFALTKSGMKSLILDLRGNPGGLVDAAIDVARRFLNSGVIASSENFDPRLSTVYQARNAAAWTIPLAVLVDADTASAAEVLAGALKDNGRARLLGQPTFGKGSSQCLIRLPDAIGGLPTGGLRLTIARFFSPKGLPYAGLGVTPDLLLQPFKPRTLDVPDSHIIAAQDELQRQLALAR